MTQECPVEIYQFAWEFDLVIDLYKRVKPRVVLEIGSLYGGTLYHWMDKADWPLYIFAVTLFENNEHDRYCRLWNHWKKYNQELEILEADSHSEETISAISTLVNNRYGSIDWLFIDGDHSYEGVKKDFESYYPMVSNNGYCIFHDIVGESGVAKLWNEIKNGKSVIEVVHTKYNLGIGIIQKWEI